MNPKIAKAIADVLREGKDITIRQNKNGVCYEVEITGWTTGGGLTLEEAVVNAFESIADE